MMIEKVATYKDYLIIKETNKHIKVLRIYDDSHIRETLIKIAEENNFSYESDWSNYQFSKALVRKDGGEKDIAIFGENNVRLLKQEKVEIVRFYRNTKEILRKISQEVDFNYVDDWNTQTHGNNLIEFIHATK